MSDKITENELKLADRVNELSDAAARPVVTGGGLFAQAVNFLMRRVSRGIMTTALIVFIAYHGFEAFNGALQAMADLQGKRAEVGATIAEEKALNTKVDGETVAVRTMKAEIDRLEQQAAATQAQADAENAKIGDGTVSLQKLRAEIAKTKAEAQEAKAQADAQTQTLNGMPVAVAQKQADVAQLEGEVKSLATDFHILMERSK
jgi:cell division protein FtsB